MSDCNTCNGEHLCAYEYKPCDCFDKRKFKEKPGIVACPVCIGRGVFPPCNNCRGSGAVIEDEPKS